MIFVTVPFFELHAIGVLGISIRQGTLCAYIKIYVHVRVYAYLYIHI
jgi:hypothetical protein